MLFILENSIAMVDYPVLGATRQIIRLLPTQSINNVRPLICFMQNTSATYKSSKNGNETLRNAFRKPPNCHFTSSRDTHDSPIIIRRRNALTYQDLHHCEATLPPRALGLLSDCAGVQPRLVYIRPPNNSCPIPGTRSLSPYGIRWIRRAPPSFDEREGKLSAVY